MKRRYIVVVLLVAVALFLGSCKSKKNNDDDNLYDPYGNSFVPGDDFDFYGDEQELGGEVTVVPAALLRLQVRFHSDFLRDIADEQGFWPLEYGLSLKIDDNGVSGAVGSMPYEVNTSTLYYVPLEVIDNIVDRGKDSYAVKACVGGDFGSAFCSGRNLINYTGESGSQIFTSAPTNLTENDDGCTSISFTLNGSNSASKLYMGDSLGYFNTVQLVRNAGTTYEQVLDSYYYSYYYCYTQYCRIYLSGINYTGSGNTISVRVRDYQGRLSPVSSPLSCTD